NVSGGSRGVAVKCHAPHPAPHRITLGAVQAARCHQGLSINDEAWTSGAPRDSAHTIRVASVVVTEPVETAGATIEHNAMEIFSYRDVIIGDYIINADGDETALDS